MHAELARQLATSRAIGDKWLRLYRDEGNAGLVNRLAGRTARHANYRPIGIWRLSTTS